MNAYLKRIQDAKEAAYSNGVLDGITYGINVAAIAYHNALGIGKERTKKAEDEVNRILQEVIDDKDPVYTAKKIQDAVRLLKE